MQYMLLCARALNKLHVFVEKIRHLCTRRPLVAAMCSDDAIPFYSTIS